jgi:endonuclease III
MAEETKARVREIIRIIREAYPDPMKGMLRFTNPFELLIATILAAQSTDLTVNEVTKTLFKKYPTPRSLATADPLEVEQDIHATGFFRQKTRSIMEASQDIVNEHGGTVPDSMEELTKLRGVGRKTANVVLGNAFGKPALVVDTHVIRVSGRLGLTDPRYAEKKEADKVEQDLMKVVPQEDWTVFSHLIVQLGRTVCTARNPKHDICPVLHLCPTGKAEMASHTLK